MDILYMGYFCNEILFNQLVKNGSNGSHARQQLETKLINGLIEVLGNNRLQIISYLPLIDKINEDAGDGEIYSGIQIEYLWCNKNKILSLLKAFIKNLSHIRQWCKGKNEKIVLTYSTNIIHVVPLVLLRKIYKFKVITICSEVSAFRRKQKLGLFGRVNRCVSSILDNSFDGYILLSKYMNEVVNSKKKPFVIVEGIASEPPLFKGLKRKRAILYAGGLTADNGIEILLEGIVNTKVPELELWICGEGPLKKVVQDYARKFKNIKFYGIIPNLQVQKLEQEAELLIAPRYSESDFTKYSFPSKTIEYMASGTPTILTRLKGIPKEYFCYSYVLEDESAKGITEIVEAIFKKNEQNRQELGQKAKQFVLEYKNGRVQAQKVLNFLLNV